MHTYGNVASDSEAPLSAKPTVLLGDDEHLMRQVLRTLLTSRGYVTYEAETGQEVVRAASGLEPDVILLDLGLPDVDGIEVIHRLRKIVQTPIIVLSVRAAQSDKIAALDAGADDYLTKPYQPAELFAHLRAALLRKARRDAPVFVAGDLEVDLAHEMARVNGKKLELTSSEYGLLRVFVQNAGRLLTQGRLAAEVWGEKPEEEALQLLRTTIGSLRAKLEADTARPRHIVTEAGVGYRLRVEQ